MLAYSIHPVMAHPLRSSLSESAVDEGDPSVGSEVLEPSLREVPVTQFSSCGCARTHATRTAKPASAVIVRQACLQSVMSPGGAMLCAVMPQVGPRWGCPHGCDTPGVNDPPRARATVYSTLLFLSVNTSNTVTDHCSAPNNESTLKTAQSVLEFDSR